MAQRRNTLLSVWRLGVLFTHARGSLPEEQPIKSMGALSSKVDTGKRISGSAFLRNQRRMAACTHSGIFGPTTNTPLKPKTPKTCLKTLNPSTPKNTPNPQKPSEHFKKYEAKAARNPPPPTNSKPNTVDIVTSLREPHQR